MKRIVFFVLINFQCAFSYCQSDIERILGENLDTIIDYRDKTFIIGPFNEKKDIAGNSYGLWKEFYSSGELKAEGTLMQRSYTQCCAAGPCEMFYRYKLGEWEYYYKNGKIKAQGVYDTQVYNFPTSCEGGDDIIIQKLSNNWKYYNKNGLEPQMPEHMIEEIMTFYTEQGKHIPNK